MNRKQRRSNKFWHGDLLVKGKNKIFVYNGCGDSLETITTHRTEMTIEELAYICIKSGKGFFRSLSVIEEEKASLDEPNEFYEEEFYYENECYAYCDMSEFCMENGYLLIENLRTEGVEIYS